MADRYEEKAREITEHLSRASKDGYARFNAAWLPMAIADALREQDAWLNAAPVSEWKITADERVLIYVVHPQAAFAKTPEERAQWQGWCVGHWTTFNKGGWTWHGHLGEVTHVAPLPAPPPDTGRGQG